MYRLIATDIDDTILAPDGTLPEANRRALEYLHQQGITVVLSSGRAIISMQEVAARILPPADDEYLIGFNGACVATMLSGTIIHEQGLSPEAMAIVIKYARQEGLLVQGYDAERFLTERDDPKCCRYAEDTGMKYAIVPDLTKALPGGSPKLVIIDTAESIGAHQKRLEALAEGHFTLTSSKAHYLEVMSPGVSKGDALCRLAAHLSIPIAETLAVGDNINDREMLEAAGLGVAVANARAELKAVADVVLERSAAEGALQEVVDRFWPS